MSEWTDTDNPPPNYTKRPRQYRKMTNPNGSIVDISESDERTYEQEGVPDGWAWVAMPKPREPATPLAPKVSKTIAHDPVTGGKRIVRGGRLAVVNGAVVKVGNGERLPQGARWATPDDAVGWNDPELTELAPRR